MDTKKAETCFGESLSLADGKIILTDLGKEGIKILFKDGRPEELCESWAHHFGPPTMKLLFEWLGNTDVLKANNMGDVQYDELIKGWVKRLEKVSNQYDKFVKENERLRDIVDKLTADKKQLRARVEQLEE